MADPHYVTSSNNPPVDDGAAKTLAEWSFIPYEEHLTVEISDGHFSVYGYTHFNPYRTADVEHDDERYEHVDTEGFLRAMAPHLAEPLVVQEICHTKCRYPLGATLYIARPDGAVLVEAFFHQKRAFLEDETKVLVPKRALVRFLELYDTLADHCVGYGYSELVGEADAFRDKIDPQVELPDD